MQNSLVFLHGWGMNKAVWQVCIEELSTHYSGDIHCLNLPGFGGADLPQGEYTLASVAGTLAKKIAPNSVIVAWSLGGLVALYLAKHYPEKVSKLVMLASTPYFVESTNWAGIKEHVLDDFKQQLSQDSNKTIERFLAIQAMGSEHAKEDIKQLRILLKKHPQPHEEALSAGLDMLKTQDLRQTFSQLQQPVFGFFGRLDALVPKKVCSKMAQLNPSFKYEIAPKASHAPFISHRAEFISYLKSIL
ncbi:MULTISPECIES: pimeloyl-ACP methyl ester esterase BioH [Pseudoalteromonas]|uniref:Pimeloyl-[acyl-carrier protein] methyl ester esterase n=1 Tax=Pseudoalteromonas amylolytica TaxID=1859457 RepID=A0A1S1MSQ3_9GAMM|nr:MULTISPECIES: pimeloyl-ACP methyl ester esterase BioH [Pseudoalteromonas]OHU86359.1 pimeloyl-[acyl-carrier protein] methyl ester esterase [Pseudoalteromonas sp. JW3]OHU89536.1 pimeloyl-[acyl-carrier protein] methyl ester esterase [Pseudoalteromonas amylolytica]